MITDSLDDTDHCQESPARDQDRERKSPCWWWELGGSTCTCWARDMLYTSPLEKGSSRALPPPALSAGMYCAGAGSEAGACETVCHLAEPDAGQGQVAAHQRHHLHHDVLARGGGEGDHRALAPAHRPHRLVSYHLHRAHASCRAEKITNLPRSTDWCRETRCTAPAGWSWGTWCRHGRTHCPWTAPPLPGSCTE